MKKFYGLYLILLSIITGFLAGILGVLTVENDILKINTYINKIDAPLIRELAFRESEKTFKDAPIDYLQKSIIGIARAKEDTTGFLDSYYLPQDIIAYGFVLTDDGWIVTLADGLEKEINSDLVIINNGQVFSFKEKIVDPGTGILFLKAEVENKNLQAIKLGDSDRINLLDDLISMNLFDGVVLHKAISLNNLDNLIQSSERLERKMIIDGETDIGTPLINSSGEVMGIVSGGEGGVYKAIFINNFKDKINEVLKSGELKRTFLGVNYIDLTEFTKDEKMVNDSFQNKGALIYDIEISGAVKKNSPAEKAGLKYRDIIISIEGEDVGVRKNLSEMIQEYKPGTEIDLDISRNKINKKITVKLGEI